MVKAYQFLKKHGVTIGFGAGGVLAILSILFIILGLGKEASNTELYASSAFNFGLFITYILFFAAVIVSLVFPSVYLAQNIKESTKLLISLGLLIVIFIISYAMASGAVTPNIAKAVATAKMGDGSLKFTETILFLGYALFFIAIGAVVFGFVRPMIAKK